MRTCTKCKTEQYIDCFYRDSNRKDGYNAWCKTCVSVSNREKYAKFRVRYRREQNASYYPGKNRTYHLQRYGITLEDYDAMLLLQNGNCAICGGNGDGGLTLNVDHDHETMQVRNLLCGSCNRGIGQFKENSKLLFLAGEYLERHGR